MKICGIYGIKNKVNGKMYVGSGRDCVRRWSYHKTQLKYDRHNNGNMQEEVNKFGLDNFQFIILEECLAKELYKKEEEYMKKYRKQLYNINGINKKDKFIRRGKAVTKYREKRSELNKGENNPRARLCEEDVINILDMLEDGVDTIAVANKYGLSENYVRNSLRTGYRWHDIVEKYYMEKEAVSFELDTTSESDKKQDK